MHYDKICKVCGAEFSAKNRRAMYCSNACRMVAYRKRERSLTRKLIKKVVAPIRNLYYYWTVHVHRNSVACPYCHTGRLYNPAEARNRIRCSECKTEWIAKNEPI